MTKIRPMKPKRAEAKACCSMSGVGGSWHSLGFSGFGWSRPTVLLPVVLVVSVGPMLGACSIPQ